MVFKQKRRKPTPGKMSSLTALYLVVLGCLQLMVEELYQLKVYAVVKKSSPRYLNEN